MTKHCILVGSNKGGVGKSLVAELVVTGYDSAFEQARVLNYVDPQLAARLKVVEIDFQHKLRDILGDRVDLSLDASAIASAASRDRNAVSNHFNAAYDVWSSGTSMTDLGANVTTPLFDWARQHDVAGFAKEDDVAFRFVAVASPADQALSAAFSSLREARQCLGDDTELFLVLNDNVGSSGFRYVEQTERWSSLKSMAAEGGVRIVNIPYCASEIMEFARANGYTIRQMAEHGNAIADEVAAKSDGSKFTARAQLKLFHDWIKAVQSEMAPIFVSGEERRAVG